MSTSEAPHTPNSTPSSGFAATFSSTLRSLEAAQKPGIGVPAYTRWVNRRVARYFAAAAVSPAGEWLDHVVDSIRVPSVHMATLLSFFLYPAHYSFSGSHAFNGWLIAMPMIFTALTAGHFMSQILAEQLRNNRKTAAPPTGGPLRSFVNLHMDAGTLCWIYIFLGFGPLFVVVYALLLLANAATILVSMRRKYVSLSTPAE